jgi:hypothetical protein
VPYALVIAGLVLVIAGVRNTQSALFALLQGDFTGNKSFVWWFLSILGIGAVGYVESVKPLANAFLALLLIVLILANKGVFQNFTNALKNPIPAAPIATATNKAA